MNSRNFRDLPDDRLVKRANKIMSDLFSKSIHSIRQITANESDAKGFYRFLLNERVTEEKIKDNMLDNCIASCKDRYVVCIQDTTEINLINHRRRIQKDNYIGTTNAKNERGLGFMVHPSLVLDALTLYPYGYADIKIWNRPQEFRSKHQRQYDKLPIEEKESYKWIEVSKKTQANLRDVVPGMIIVQDREGDIYEQFAVIPDDKTDLLIRARTNRTLADGKKLFDCLSDAEVAGSYAINIPVKKERKSRTAQIEIRYKPIEILKTSSSSKNAPKSIPLYLIEAKEVSYNNSDKICWRLLTTIPITNIEFAKLCIEWYSCRWTIEEVFRTLKKEGYNIEASELEHPLSIRKMTLMIMEVIIKLFLMRLAYAEPEVDVDADSCFTQDEQEFLEHQIVKLEGKTEKQKNPYKAKDLKRYVWVIARLGGWKGYESKRHHGITTLWIGLKNFKQSYEGWQIHRDVSTR
ncbi:MAG: IS4 family transposase [Bacteroidales bacterium]|nr:IS4 family transposase [Bacteroidales bacterium]